MIGQARLMEKEKERVVGVLGAGWLGFPLVTALLGLQIRVKASSRSSDKLTALKAEGATAIYLDLPTGNFSGFLTSLTDLVITIPPGGRRYKALATERYLEQLTALQPFLLKLPELRILYCSSTGVYGDVTGLIDEEEPVAPTTYSAKAVVAAEKYLASLPNPLAILRFGGLVGPGRHPGRFFGGKNLTLSQSDAPVNLVHQADAVSALVHVIKFFQPVVYNVTAAAHPTKGEFYSAASRAIGLDINSCNAGGASGKIVSSQRLRSQGWVPEYDDLKTFLTPSCD